MINNVNTDNISKNETDEGVINDALENQEKRPIWITNRIRFMAHRWVTQVSFNDFYEDIACHVIGQPNLKVFLANLYNYLNRLGEKLPTNNNVILAAPSGSGKTETYRALKRYFNEKIPGFPISILDLSQITATGFKGAEPCDMINPFIIGNEAFGICFLDEFDKKLEPSYASRGIDVNREVQNTLFTIIEGGNINTKAGLINTSDIMFVGLGSFDKFREKRESKVNAIGFGAENDEAEVDHYEPITRENMIEHGGTNELIGRFPFIINYGVLSDEAVNGIIKKDLENIQENYGCEITLSNTFKDELLKMATSKFGCRQIDSAIRSLVLQEYTQSLCETGGEKLVVKLEDYNNATHYWENYTNEEVDKALIEMLSEDELRQIFEEAANDVS